LVNIGYGSDISISDLAILLAEIVGFNGKLIFDTKKPDGTYRKLMDSGKLNGMGWTPKIKLNDGIRKTVEDFMKIYK